MQALLAAFDKRGHLSPLQNYFHDTNNFAPRFSIAYAPGNGKANVLRAGVGVFNDRSGPVVIADVLHSQSGGLIFNLLQVLACSALAPAQRSNPNCTSRSRDGAFRSRRQCEAAAATHPANASGQSVTPHTACRLTRVAPSSFRG
jgi:hypothetical protein